MAEELQHLIERIQQDAIESTKAEAEQMLSKAREKAASTVKDAEAKSKALLEKAEEDAKRFVEHSERTLEQAARDLLISVGQGVENILCDLVGESVKDAMDMDTLRKILIELVKVYAERDGAESRVEFLVPEKDQESLIRFFTEQFGDHLDKGITLRAESGLHKGFRVECKNGAISHDFSQTAIAESLSSFLRPHLAEIVHRAARKTET